MHFPLKHLRPTSHIFLTGSVSGTLDWVGHAAPAAENKENIKETLSMGLEIIAELIMETYFLNNLDET